MAKPLTIFILLDLGTPKSPLVATYRSYQEAEAQRAMLSAANNDSTDFVVEESQVN
jgi:hypothetical protein